VGRIPQRGAEGQVENSRALFMGLEISSGIRNQGPERGSHLSTSHSISEISQLVDGAFLNHMSQMGREEVLTLAHHASPLCSPSKPVKTPVSMRALSALPGAGSGVLAPPRASKDTSAALATRTPHLKPAPSVMRPGFRSQLCHRHTV